MNKLKMIVKWSNRYYCSSKSGGYDEILYAEQLSKRVKFAIQNDYML